jgi:hypothetical protein
MQIVKRVMHTVSIVCAALNNISKIKDLCDLGGLDKAQLLSIVKVLLSRYKDEKNELDLAARRKLGDRFGPLRNSMFGKFSRQHQTHSRLNFTTAQSRLFGE